MTRTVHRWNIEKIRRKSPDSNLVHFQGCPFIDTQQYLTDLLSKCPQLILLDVEGTYIVDHAFTIIARQCPHLRYLFIGCTSLNDTVVLSLPERSFTHLSSLCIIQVSELPTCFKLQSIAVSRFIFFVFRSMENVKVVSERFKYST